MMEAEPYLRVKQLTDKSAIVEHAWNSHCPIKWEEASVLNHVRNPPDLMIKKAIHIPTTPLDSLINRDKGAEIPGCWVAPIMQCPCIETAVNN